MTPITHCHSCLASCWHRLLTFLSGPRLNHSQLMLAGSVNRQVVRISHVPREPPVPPFPQPTCPATATSCAPGRTGLQPYLSHITTQLMQAIPTSTLPHPPAKVLETEVSNINANLLRSPVTWQLHWLRTGADTGPEEIRHFWATLVPSLARLSACQLHRTPGRSTKFFLYFPVS